jgi:predicted ATPase
LKPITVLLGRNSSGKSSFLRIFPLLKQSVEEKTKSPLLLYGRYVDFGSYKDIKPNIPDCNGQFEISFTIPEIEHNIRYRGNFHSLKLDCVKCPIKFGMTFEEDKKQSLHISCLNVDILGNTYSLRNNHRNQKVSQIEINNETIFNEEDDLRVYDQGEFTLEVYTIIKSRQKSDEENRYHAKELASTLEEKIILFLKNYTRGGTSNSTLKEIVKTLKLDNDQSILDQLKSVKKPVSWSIKIKNWSIKSKPFITLRNLLILHYIHTDLLYNINLFLKELSQKVKYLAPLRATAERYYRIQHLAENEVDPNGKNLPVFLDSLTDIQKSSFTEWTIKHFGFSVNIHKSEGHYSINIAQSNHPETNLSDMGFGYSQILPILTQIWYSSIVGEPNKIGFARKARSIPQIIAIEQPELHLHPEFQAKFADAIVKIVQSLRGENHKIILIIETHSDTIVNRLGECVQENEIPSESIEIAIFNKDSNSSATNVSKSSFDQDGNLTNWPFGFFHPNFK